MSTECSILFADVTGSTQLYEQKGDDFAQRVVGKLLDALTRVIGSHNGTVVKYIGDEVMARFPEADQALQAAIGMQEAASAMTDETGCRIKIGCHHGQVVETADDIFGDSVNIAARMTGLAKAGEILTTEELVKQLNPVNKRMCWIFDHTKVKGKAKTIAVYTVVWQEDEFESTVIHHGVDEEAAEEEERVLLLKFQENTYEVHSGTAFTLGRGLQCDLTVAVSSASREHAKINYRNGKFYLEDQSTNGTCVRTEDGNLMYLRREETVLWGHGVVCLGANFDEVEAHLKYECPQ